MSLGLLCRMLYWWLSSFITRRIASAKHRRDRPYMPLATAKTISRGMRARRTAESNMAGAEAEGRATGAHDTGSL
eukprot:CAMPEP_0175669674 /NCGR_PEP_ID=MMETSP0097-20121207/19266_1 /TAXON_ID=311494 /ORGANISM="Alexandrium monilatum, Strain CCMP3105" /LENGTH=74 /DNA_ID=CAMNT_0016976225 /DNA_START=279 /DNA_END=500 /DNA_ORIENTATION=-